MSKIKPISPDEIGAAKIASLRDEVIAAFNELIAENWTGNQAVVYQNEAMARVLSKFNWEPERRREVFDRHYLDVEPAFQEAGWLVEYDKPAYNESYEAKFIFTKNIRGF